MWRGSCCRYWPKKRRDELVERKKGQLSFEDVPGASILPLCIYLSPVYLSELFRRSSSVRERRWKGDLANEEEEKREERATYVCGEELPCPIDFYLSSLLFPFMDHFPGERGRRCKLLGAFRKRRMGKERNTNIDWTALLPLKSY